MPSAADVRELAERHVAAWQDHNADAVAETYAPDAVFTINTGDPMNGRDDIAAMVRGFAAEFPDMTLSLDGCCAAADDGIYIWTFEGTHRDSGNRVRFSGWEAWKFNEAGQVASSLGYYDEDEYAHQLGGITGSS